MKVHATILTTLSVMMLTACAGPTQTPHSRGDVVIKFVVNEQGDVENAWIVSGFSPDCDKAALTAVKKWHFKPGMKDGHPVKVTMEETMHFDLRDDR